MNQTILFSPVGGTDPISWNNGRDGSMLHICRWYKPDKVYLYLSGEMLKFQEQDDRYRYCLKKLQELQQRSMNIEEIQRPDLVEVEDYNVFYNDFRTILVSIMKEMDSTDCLLLNVSSGTPAMKSCLMVLATLGEIRCTAVQVVTPVRKINDHTRDQYDVELAWEVDEDNEDGQENRCREVKCPALLRMRQEDIIKRLIREYDYKAALVVADTMIDGTADGYRNLLLMAEDRLLLKTAEANKIAKQEQCSCIPVKRAEDQTLFEYALTMDIKLRKGEYADFARGLSPLIVALFENILKHRFNVDAEQYIRVNERRGGQREWDDKQLMGTEVLAVLNASYRQHFSYGFIKSDHFMNLIDHYGSGDVALTRLVDSMRGVEEAIRNKAAHEMVSVTDENIKHYTGYTSQQIMDQLKSLFRYSSVPVKPEYWQSYDQMNDFIIGRISLHPER